MTRNFDALLTWAPFRNSAEAAANGDASARIHDWSVVPLEEWPQDDLETFVLICRRLLLAPAAHKFFVREQLGRRRAHHSYDCSSFDRLRHRHEFWIPKDATAHAYLKALLVDLEEGRRKVVAIHKEGAYERRVCFDYSGAKQRAFEKAAEKRWRRAVAKGRDCAVRERREEKSHVLNNMLIEM